MTAPETAAGASWRGTRVLVGLSRAQERRLRSLWLEELGLQVMARCGSAPQLLGAAGRGEANVALVDEDLHRFDSAHRAAAWQAGTPLVALVRDRDDPRWRDVPGLVLPLEAELPAVLDALGRAAGGERHVQTPKPSGKAHELTSPTSTPIGATHVPVGPSRLQVLAFWAARGHGGSTLLATSCAAILGSAASTVLVDLDVSGAAVGVQLEDGQQGRVRSSLGDLVSADLDSHEAWQRELDRTLQPLGTYAKQAQVLCGLQRRRQRVHVSTALVERLVAELRTRFAFVVLDVGADSPADSQVTAAALRAADQLLVVATPDPVGLRRAADSVQEAARLLDLGRAALVLNRYDGRVHTDLRRVDAEIGLPIVSLVPEDTRTVQRALLAGQPAVCEPASRIRRPLLDLMDRVAAGSVAWPGHLKDPWAAPPLWSRLRTALAPAALASLVGGSR
jgi:MinD-like ATPase involved in chromosome partitioning or flagellar assembly